MLQIERILCVLVHMHCVVTYFWLSKTKYKQCSDSVHWAVLGVQDLLDPLKPSKLYLLIIWDKIQIHQYIQPFFNIIWTRALHPQQSWLNVVTRVEKKRGGEGGGQTTDDEPTRKHSTFFLPFLFPVRELHVMYTIYTHTCTHNQHNSHQKVAKWNLRCHTIINIMAAEASVLEKTGITVMLSSRLPNPCSMRKWQTKKTTKF